MLTRIELQILWTVLCFLGAIQHILFEYDDISCEKNLRYRTKIDGWFIFKFIIFSIFPINLIFILENIWYRLFTLMSKPIWQKKKD